MIDLRLGDALTVLRTMPDESVHCIVTSPPYWGLRSYGTEPQIWQNGHELCAEHQWGDILPSALKPYGNQFPQTMGAKAGPATGQNHDAGNLCSICGCWRGELGLEPTPELYVAHIVQIFHEARRVLRDDGTAWINLGDSYWGGKGSNGSSKARRTATVRGYQQSSGTVLMDTRPQDGKHSTLKPKDLVGIPWRVAFALQADGWYLRSDIIWSKPNPMPESVTDRPTKAHEYIFLLAKSERYYYDAESVKEPVAPASIERMKYGLNATENPDPHDMRHGNGWKRCRNGETMEQVGFVHPAGRNRRTVWTVSTQPYKNAHFATYPEKLIEPCVLAGCPEGGTVLDPFGGSGTTGAVAAKFNRNAILIDLKPEYLEMQRQRIGLFAAE